MFTNLAILEAPHCNITLVNNFKGNRKAFWDWLYHGHKSQSMAVKMLETIGNNNFSTTVMAIY